MRKIYEDRNISVAVLGLISVVLSACSTVSVHDSEAHQDENNESKKVVEHSLSQAAYWRTF